MRKLHLVGVLFVLCAALSFGQGANGTITGTVTDQTGAIIADAQIQVKNAGTGQVFNGVSTATGNYAIPQLPVGTYDLTATMTGFKTYNRVGLALAAAQIMRIDIPFEIGAATESVTVSAEASLLKTETGDLVHNVTVSQMTNLPILSVGGTGTGASSGFRDPFALATMIPGVNYTPNLTMIINGNPDDTMQIRVEGITGGNTGGLRQYTAQQQPSVDAVEQVAVQTSNYAAEFGTAGGGIFNLTMKSGTNEYHGSLYNYMANDALNAYQPYTGLRNATKRYDYGMTFGGPVRIPKVYDGRNRTFFFWNWEQFREKLMISSLSPTVPTLNYRQGNFTELWTANNNRLLREGSSNYVDPLGQTVKDRTIFDPASTQTVVCPPSGSNCTPGSNLSYRTPFLNNTIPLTRFDPVSVNVLKLVPLPEGGNAARGQLGNNFQRPWRSSRTSEIPSIKIDQTIGSNGRLSGYWQDTGTTSPYSFPNGSHEGLVAPITGARGTFIYTRTIRANYDHTISPTILLHIGAGWNHNNFDDHSPLIDDLGPFDSLATLGLPNSGIKRTFPVITTAASTALGGMNTLGTGGQGNSFERRPSGVANLSWIKNNHSFKFGAEYRLEKYPTRGFTNVSGNYGFGTNATLQTALQGRALSQGTTGFEFASFLLGGLSSATLAVPLPAGTSKSQWAMFAQDTWKVTRNFTLDYGLRWDYGTYAAEQYGRYANFDANLPNPSAGGHPGAQNFEALCNCKFADNYPYAVAPRVGVSYSLNSKTVLRGGFGIVYSATGLASGSAVNSANAGAPGFGLTIGQFKDGIPSDVRPVFPNFAPNAGQPNGAVVGAPTFLDPNAGRPARQYQWSVSLQREITRNLVVEASYVANRGVWWPAGISALNAMTNSRLGSYGFSLNDPADGRLLNKQISSLTAAERSLLTSRGVVTPYAGYSTGQTVRQSMLPFPQYTGTLAPAGAPLGKTWYDGLQLNVTQRLSHGLSFNFNYTLSKALDQMGSPDVFNPTMGKDLQGTDTPQSIRMSAEYQTPNLRTSGISGLNNRIVSYILSDWGLGWYFQYQSAAVLGRPANQGALPISQWLGRGPGPAQYVEGQPLYTTNWVDYDGNVRTDELDLNCHCFDPTKTVVLNPAAWSNIPDGTWGAQQTTIRQFRGFRFPQENINVSRNFRIKERVTIHIRAEFQNATNRMRLPQPVTGANYTATQQKFTSGANAGLFSGGFGTVLPTSGTNGARTGTLIMRVTF